MIRATVWWHKYMNMTPNLATNATIAWLRNTRPPPPETYKTTTGRTDKRSRLLSEPAYVSMDTEVTHDTDGSRGTLQRRSNLMGTCVPTTDTTWCSRGWCSPGSHEKILTNKRHNNENSIPCEIGYLRQDRGRPSHTSPKTQNGPRTWIYSSSSPFLERLLLLRDLRRLGAAFLLLRLLDFLRRFADFLLGADFLRDARRLFGAMVG